MRLCMPDSAVRGIEVQGAQTGRTTAYNGRIVEVNSLMHQRALREQGAFPASLSGIAASTDGFHCNACGFASFFVRCGRCGETCEKEI